MPLPGAVNTLDQGLFGLCDALAEDGISAAISYENGENIPSLPTPGVNVKVYLPNSFYTKVGVQRALSPDRVSGQRGAGPDVDLDPRRRQLHVEQLSRSHQGPSGSELCSLPPG